jgi:predicted NBD/HSP70 family sugar kinase
VAAGWDDLRAHNMAVLFRTTWKAQRISRAELARRTGLSRATVSDIVARFIDAGMVEETEDAAPRTSSGGRPPTILRFVDESRSLLGVELGASHVSVVRTDLRGHVLARGGAEVPVAQDPHGTLATMTRIAREVCHASGGTHLVGIGLGLPTPLQDGRGAVLSPRLFPAWEGVDAAAPLVEAFEVPVHADNDANLGALAEHWWGAGRGVDDLAYIKVATGVGAGILIGGEIHRGARGIAGEIGHTSIDPQGARCRCGLTGCLEAFVGTTYLLDRVRQACAARGTSPSWAEPHPTVGGLIAAAAAGDPVAAALVEDAGRHLGVAVANLVNLVNPARVILGGRLTDAGPVLLRALEATVRERALWTSVDAYEVRSGTLGDDAVALGAATAILRDALDHPASLLAPRGASALSGLSSSLPQRRSLESAPPQGP